MEFVEMLKVDEKFLYSLLTLSQEQNIKTGRFAMIYADEVILSHTNENEYVSFAGNRKSEALQDRIILVRVPYNLRVSQEEKFIASCCINPKRCAAFILRRTLCASPRCSP
jgi:serine protein kinase